MVYLPTFTPSTNEPKKVGKLSRPLAEGLSIWRFNQPPKKWPRTKGFANLSPLVQGHQNRWILHHDSQPLQVMEKNLGCASCLPLSLRGGSMGNCLDSWMARGRQRWEELNDLQHGRRVCLCVLYYIPVQFYGGGEDFATHTWQFLYLKRVLRIWTKKLAYPSYPIGSI